MAARLDIPKVVQAGAIILQTDRHGRMPYIRLLKLLYLVDRESLQERGWPVTGDRVVAMQHGPVLSGTYDLIKGEHIRTQEWARFIRTDGFHAEMITFPGTGELSRWEIAKIHEVVARHSLVDDWALIEHLHEELPEWRQHQPEGTGSNPIPLGDILRAVGRGEDAEQIQADLDAREGLRRLAEGLPG